MGIEIKQTTNETLPMGEYDATINDVVEEEGKFGPQLKIIFELTKEQKILSAWCSRSFSPKSKLYRWTRAAFGGREIPPSYNFNSDHIINKPVRLAVLVKTRPDGTEYNKIDDVRPSAAAARAQRPVPVSADEAPF